MQTKCTAPARDTAAAAPSVSRKELAERRLAHLARGHGELAMPALGVGVAVDLHVVRRIQERGVDRRTVADDAPQEVCVATVAAADAVLAENPDVAELRPGLDRDGGNDLLVGIIRGLEHDVDLAAGEAGQRQVEVDVERADVVKLEPQDLDVPAGIQRDLVVGEAERLLLGFGEPAQLDRWHFARARSPAPLAAVRDQQSERDCSSTSTGLVNPNCRIDEHSCSICRLGWVRALRGSGRRSPIGR